MDLNNDDKPKKVKYGDKLWFLNEETGEWSPVMQIESIECTINLTEEDEAKLAKIVEPLGDLEIVPREE